ncbi:MAG: sugar phosphate isomerase/epimerase family protein [Bryobacteraceae bacterium]
MTRRDLLAAMAAAPLAAASKPGLPICAFSKHFQWTDVRGAAELCAALGYDGLDLTLRKGGHVLPERVEEDLPKAVAIAKGAGLSVPMVTSDIVDARTPHAETVIKTLAKLGIRNYRWGGFRWAPQGSLPEQIEGFKARTKELAAMNKQYGVCAMYHTHSGLGQVGASFWDLYLVLKDFSPDAVSVNYDVGHATVEGGFGGWIASTRLLLPYMRGIAVKDFYWEKNAKGQWRPRWCALGQGMVDFKQFLGMVKAAGFTGPLQLHMEYDELGGADSGKTTFTIPKEKLVAIMKRDIETFKAMLREAGMA